MVGTSLWRHHHVIFRHCAVSRLTAIMTTLFRLIPPQEFYKSANQRTRSSTCSWTNQSQQSFKVTCNVDRTQYYYILLCYKAALWRANKWCPLNWTCLSLRWADYAGYYSESCHVTTDQPGGRIISLLSSFGARTQKKRDLFEKV